jgi:hypothetical protein
MDLDLSTVVISPWDNDKGIVSTPPRSNFESQARDRSASLASQRTTTPRTRSKSNPAARASDTRDNDDDDLLGEWQINTDSDGLRSSFNRKTFDETAVDFATRGGQLDMDSGSQRQRSRNGSSPKPPMIPMRKELRDGLEDGIPRAIALFEFAAAVSGDLSFKKGDVIVVTKGDKRDEWWTGRNTRTGSSGIFP